MVRIKYAMTILSLFWLTIFSWYGNASSTTKTNILFLMMDDMRPLMNAYGIDHMITPNMDKLASRSVLFENAFCAVPVCCPSRNSMVTGLKPETIHSYGFENTFAPHISFPEHFKKINYNVAGFGKFYHANGIEGNVRGVGFGIDESKWYDYQNEEGNFLNSTVNPDRNTPEDHFRDYMFTTKALEGLDIFSSMPNYFFLSLGFKLPHIAIHFPHKYFEMYRQNSSVWESVTSKHLRLPPTAPAIAFHCCSETTYSYMNEEGNARAIRHESAQLYNLTAPKPRQMYIEMIWAYSASISFLDVQIGRVMAKLDELSLWDNITIVLTSDHGMNNGEKGIWEKWNLYEESTRIPLIIYHPQSPFKGQRYKLPVEHIDIYPTLLDLANEPQLYGETCPPKIGRRRKKICHPLEGQSLVPVIMGSNEEQNGSEKSRSSVAVMSDLPKTFAVSQVIRCAKKSTLNRLKTTQMSRAERNKILVRLWEGCAAKDDKSELTLMGYSLRTASFRYTAYLPFNRTLHHVRVHDGKNKENAEITPMYEELYDHRLDHNMTLNDRELVNLAKRPKYKVKTKEMLAQLLSYLNRETPPLFGVAQ